MSSQWKQYSARTATQTYFHESGKSEHDSQAPALSARAPVKKAEQKKRVAQSSTAMYEVAKQIEDNKKDRQQKILQAEKEKIQMEKAK